VTKKMHCGDTTERLAIGQGISRNHVLASNRVVVAGMILRPTRFAGNCGDARGKWNAEKNRMLLRQAIRVSSDHCRYETFDWNNVFNSWNTVVEARYTTAIVVGQGGRSGIYSPQREQFLPGAQRARGRQGEASSPCAAGRTRIDYRPGCAGRVTKTPICEAQLAGIACAGFQRPCGIGKPRFARGTAFGRRIEGIEPGTCGSVSADRPDFRITRGGAGVALTVATPAVDPTDQTSSV
jgi:hypothetical protein